MKSSCPEHYVVTYCSRDKDPSSNLMPAGDRYLSSRIGMANEVSSLLEVGVLILSGKYGLIGPDLKIPDYDHLLTQEQVPGHAQVLGQSLRQLEATKIMFITRDLTIDPGTGPYREAMRLACLDAGVDFRVKEMGLPEPSPAELAAMIRPWFNRPSI